MLKKLAQILLFGGMAATGNCNDLLKTEELKTRLTSMPALTQQQHKERRKYAVIINGDSSALHRGNVHEAYASLQALGFSDQETYILSTEPLRKNGITAHATAANIPLVLNHLEKRVDANDLLVLYTTGHGVLMRKETGLVLEDAIIAHKGIKKLVGKVKAQDYVCVSDQCYSGGLAKELSTLRGNVVAYASTDESHSTLCQSFARPFWESFRNGKADVNKDKKTTLDEAFEYAAAIHSAAADVGDEESNQAQAYRSKRYPQELR
ncbi:caspase family protein [Candidatus Woesearchaeota archaeon]|nr:caspase family protein [Candidatus Woesearchaeota archaeon]